MICFFPFTHITAAQKQVLGRFFNEVRVLDLGGRDRQGAPREDVPGSPDLVSCRIPEERAALLDAKLAEYLSWAQLHRGNERNLKHLLKASPYFKSDTDLTSIKSQITRGEGKAGEVQARETRDGETRGGEKDNPGNMPDPGLFLKLAQTLDQENDLIASRLEALDQGKNALLAELKGEIETSEPEKAPAGAGDQGMILPDRRMAAWAQLAAEAGLFTGDGPVLATTSPGMFDWLTEGADGVINGLDIDPIKVHENECENRDEWSRDFDNLLDQISAGSQRLKGETLEGRSGCCHLSGQIKIRLFTQGTLNKLYGIPGSQLMVCLVGLNS